jgi:hypothetical protein
MTWQAGRNAKNVIDLLFIKSPTKLVGGSLFLVAACVYYAIQRKIYL